MLVNRGVSFLVETAVVEERGARGKEWEMDVDKDSGIRCTAVASVC